MVAQADPSERGSFRLSSLHFSVVLLVVSALLMIAHSMGVLPAWLVRLPEAVIPPTAEVLDVVFAFVQNDLGLIHVTRSIAAGLEYLLDATGNILYGKNRFPYLNRVSFLFIESLGPIPWSAVAAGMAVLGFWLGGWRMAILAGGTFVWTAMIGQWDIAMQTMSVLDRRRADCVPYRLDAWHCRLAMALGRSTRSSQSSACCKPCRSLPTCCLR